jgi:hypothetical protein
MCLSCDGEPRFGKDTLIHLLFRDEDGDQGIDILIEGRIREEDRNALRTYILEKHFGGNRFALPKLVYCEYERIEKDAREWLEEHGFVVHTVYGEDISINY